MDISSREIALRLHPFARCGGQGETNTTKEKSNMDFTLDFDVVAHK